MKLRIFKTSSAALLIGLIVLISLVCVGVILHSAGQCGEVYDSPAMCAAMTFHQTIIQVALPILPIFLVLILSFSAARMLREQSRLKVHVRTAMVHPRISGFRRPEQFDVLVELFSQGILNPKLYG